jgi:hypothetical protein
MDGWMDGLTDCQCSLGTNVRLFVMQYLEGVQVNASCNEIFAKQPELLQQVGQWIAFDMLVNNFDRVPLIWDNQGNGGNLLIDSKQQRVYGIDHRVTPIVVHDGVERYREQVSQMIAQCREWTAEQSQVSDSELQQNAALQRVQQFFTVYACLTLSRDQLLAMCTGVIDGCVQIVQIMTDELMQQTIDRVRQDLEIEEQGSELDNIVAFLHETRSCITEAVRDKKDDVM